MLSAAVDSCCSVWDPLFTWGCEVLHEQCLLQQHGNRVMLSGMINSGTSLHAAFPLFVLHVSIALSSQR